MEWPLSVSLYAEKTVRDLTGLQDIVVKLINYANWKKKNPRASAAQDLITARFY